MRDYWERRLAAHFDVRGVGNIGFSVAYNRWLYFAKGVVLRRELGRALPDPSSSPVLDVGSGTGFVVEQWLRLGCRDLTGVDLTQNAIDRLRRRFPNVHFERGDIGGENLALDGSYAAVSAIDVLYHVTDDEAYARALRRIAGLLRPGAPLVLTESFPASDEPIRVPHQVFRPWPMVRRLLADCGLEVVRRRPLFVFMEKPLRPTPRWATWTWPLVGRLARTRNAVSGPWGLLLLPWELLAGRWARRGPSVEVVVCRRSAGGAADDEV